MSPRSLDPSSPTDEGDFDSQPPDERERAEAKWLLARESDPGAPAPSAEVAKDYEELEHLLATLPEPASDHSWHAEVLRQAAASKPVALGESSRPTTGEPAAIQPLWRRRAVRWASSGVAAAAAAAIAIAVLRTPSEQTPSGGEVALLTVEPLSSEGSVRSGSDRLGGLRILASKGDVRVFRISSEGDGTLTARCTPDKAGCKEIGDRLAFEAPINTVGTYVVVLVVGKLDISESASMREFSDAAETSGIKPTRSKPFKRD
jgi:hypothetical protein